MKSPTPTVEETPAPSFYAALAHKLRLIIWAEGSKKAAARKLGAHISTMRRWVEHTASPDLNNQARIDLEYLCAWEKRRLGRVPPPARPRAAALGLRRVNSVDAV